VVTDLNHGVTPQGLADSLIGGGVTISNVSYTGGPNAAGKFSGGAGIVGFPSGMVLGTGSVQTTPANAICGNPGKGIEGPNQCPFNTTSNGTAGDPALTTLAGFPTLDAAVLQFDFVPQFSSIQVQYVFVSEEYNEYANTQFNDTFAFFVNGTNCATVPGTGQPVSVNTVNGGRPLGVNPRNAQFFRNNELSTSPFVPGTINTEADGLTTVLTCRANVNQGVVNRMRLAIADGSDNLLDSNVLLAAGSFISGSTVTTSLSGGGGSGSQITVPVGTAVRDSATLAGANIASAGGTLSYKLYSDTGCTTLVTNAGTRTVSQGVVSPSDPVILQAPGTYYWLASYSGDVTNAAAVSVCGGEVETLTAPAISARGTTFSAIAGREFNYAVALFTVLNGTAPAGAYSATIDWGDGSPVSSATIVGDPGGPFNVVGSHAYAQAGNFTAQVTISEPSLSPGHAPRFRLHAVCGSATVRLRPTYTCAC
jgi:hypothetical protein